MDQISPFIRSLLLIFFLTGLLIKPVAVADNELETYRLPEIAKMENLSGYTAIWEDVSAKANLDQARRAFEEGKFVAAHGKTNIGFSNHGFWFYFQVENPSQHSRELIVEAAYPVLDFIGVYCSAGGQHFQYMLGDHLLAADRPIHLSNHVFPVTIDPKHAVSCFLQVVSSSNINLPLTISDEYAYLEAVEQSQWLLGLFYGLAIAMVVFSLLLFFAFRRHIFLFYGLHCLGAVLLNAALDGSSQSFWQYWLLPETGPLISILLSQFGSLYFSLKFLRVGERYPWLFRFSQLFSLFAGLLLILMPFLTIQLISILVTLSSFCLLLFLFFLGILRLHDNYWPSWFFLIGWGPVFFMALIIALSVTGLLKHSLLIIHGMKLAWCFEMFVLGIGVTWYLNRLQRKRLSELQYSRDSRAASLGKEQFLAKISHEIRGSMSGMLGLTALVSDTPLNPEQRRYVNALHKGTESLLDITNDFLDYSKIQAGKLTLVRKAFNLLNLLDDTLTIYEPLARQKKLDYRYRVAAGTPINVAGDPLRIRQVLLNLVSNALKYTDAGEVMVSIRLTDQILDQQVILRVTVEDTGFGIDPGDRQRLFQDYSQLDVKGSSPDSTGLGLLISRNLVELMGGALGVKSKPGHGSNFWFTLPLWVQEDHGCLQQSLVSSLVGSQAGVKSDAAIHPPPLDTASDSVSAAESIAMTADTHILVVEDNYINQQVIEGFLERVGLRAVYLRNGQQALQHIKERSQPYDLILMDCEMPIMNGYKATEKILAWQRQQGLPLTPVIALSAHNNDEHLRKVKAAGMTYSITKPLDFNTLAQVILEFKKS